MDSKCVKDLMVPLDEYAVIAQDDTVINAIKALDEAQLKLPPGKYKHRAVLVVDNDNKVVGKIGQLSFLMALEPKYNVMSDLATLDIAGVDSQYLSQMMEHYQLFQDNLSDLVVRAHSIKVKEIMQPVAEGIDEDAPLSEAIHKIIMRQRFSILVLRKGKTVGVLRLSDLFEEMSVQMKKLAT